MHFDFGFMARLIPLMLVYSRVTLSIATISILAGLFIAFCIALIIHAKVPFFHRIFKIYISFFRGTPLMAQLYCFYFGVLPMLPSLTTRVSSFQAAAFVMSLNSAAYMAESLRGAISSVDKGQMEACLSIGMTYFQAMVYIVFPQAFRVAIPTLASSFINVVKDSSLTFTIAVKEMMAVAQLEANSSYKYLEAFVTVLLMYWMITSILGLFQKKLERRMNRMVGESA